MIDEILEFTVDLLVELVPNTIWKIILLLVGVVTAAIGATLINESTQVGGTLMILGTVLTIISLLLLYRQ